MEKKNTGLVVLVMVLSLMVVGLSGFVIYDKVLSDKEKNTNVLDNDTTKEIISKEEIKEIFKFVYNYIEMPEVYCGEDEIISDVNDEMHMYHLSKQYSTYNELINDLKKYMSINVISKGTFTSTDKGNYVEKDGKLYCKEQYKGYPYDHGNVDIELTSQSEYKITCIATMELTDMSNNKTYNKVNLTLEKDNENWVITSYEKQ